MFVFFFFFNDTATTEIYTLSLHDALPILRRSVEAELQLPVGVGPLERHQDVRVRLVADIDVVLGPAPPLLALRAERGGRVRVRQDLDGEVGGRRLAAAGPRVRDDPQVPHTRLGLRSARRVEVDLDLLLVRAAGAER